MTYSQELKEVMELIWAQNIVRNVELKNNLEKYLKIFENQIILYLTVEIFCILNSKLDSRKLLLRWAMWPQGLLLRCVGNVMHHTTILDDSYLISTIACKIFLH